MVLENKLKDKETMYRHITRQMVVGLMKEKESVLVCTGLCRERPHSC